MGGRREKTNPFDSGYKAPRAESRSARKVTPGGGHVHPVLARLPSNPFRDSYKAPAAPAFKSRQAPAPRAPANRYQSPSRQYSDADSSDDYSGQANYQSQRQQPARPAQNQYRAPARQERPPRYQPQSRQQ